MLSLTSIRSALDEHVRSAATPAVPTSAALVERPRAFSWRAVIAQGAAFWIATRIALLLLTAFGIYFGGQATPAQLAAHPFSTYLSTWNHWDAIWYVRIAQRGYYDIQPTAFFPLYPILIKAVTLVVGQSHALLAAMLISNAAALGAFVGMGLFAANEDGIAGATPAMRMLAVYPLAFFLAAPYTEALFVAFSVFSLFFMRRGQWRWASLCALLASLTRPTGAILYLPLLWEFARQHGWLRVEWLRGGWRATAQDLFDLRNPRDGSLLADLACVLASVPAGFALFAGYLGLRFHHPLIFLHVQDYFWHRQNVPIWQTLPTALHRLLITPGWSYWQARQLIDVFPVFAFGLLILLSIRRIPFAFSLYTLGLIYLAVMSPMPSGPVSLVSAGRFLVAAAPIFLLLGRWTARRPWLDLLLTSGGIFLQAVIGLLFLTGRWIV